MVSRAWPDGGGMGQIATDYRQNQANIWGNQPKQGKSGKFGTKIGGNREERDTLGSLLCGRVGLAMPLMVSLNPTNHIISPTCRCVNIYN